MSLAYGLLIRRGLSFDKYSILKTVSSLNDHLNKGQNIIPYAIDALDHAEITRHSYKPLRLTHTQFVWTRFLRNLFTLKLLPYNIYLPLFRIITIIRDKTNIQSTRILINTAFCAMNSTIGYFPALSVCRDAANSLMETS